MTMAIVIFYTKLAYQVLSNSICLLGLYISLLSYKQEETTQKSLFWGQRVPKSNNSTDNSNSKNFTKTLLSIRGRKLKQKDLNDK